MGDVRACTYVLVTLLSLHLVAGKPFFGALWCYLIYDDCDDPTSTTASYEDMYDYDMCDCAPRRRTTPRPLVGQPLAGQPLAGQPLAGQPLAGQPWAWQPLAGQPPRGPISMIIPPANGMNLTLSNFGNEWRINAQPFTAPPGGQATPAPVAPVAPVAPAAPGATPAPAAAATTVAPTTAAAGK